ncbi:MAG: helix-turn-helix transcriptional regulator [Bacteroidales bacterium]|nr:helix-turn-helix transcriptional regulator [Bacteroidales bacterium]
MGNKDNKYFDTWKVPDNYAELNKLSENNCISPDLVLIMESKIIPRSLISAGHLLTTNEGRIFIITKGTLDVNINLFSFHAVSGQVLVAPIGAIVELKDRSDDLEYQGFVFRDLPIPQSLRKPVLVKATNCLLKRLKGYLHSMLLLTKEQPLNLQAVKHLQQAFLADIAACADQMHQQPHNQPEDYKEHYFFHFIELVNKYCTTEHNVSFYAGQLNISPNRLSAVIKAYSGKTVLQWLHHRLALQAKVLLQNSQLSIGNIASCLGFKNQAEFTRFFKRATGISPKDYRNNINIPFI